MAHWTNLDLDNYCKRGQNRNSVRVALAFFVYTDRHGRPPTVREVMGMTGISTTSVVFHHMKKLLREGFLEKQDDFKQRKYELTDLGRRLVCMAQGLGFDLE